MKKSDFPIFKEYPDLVYLDSGATSQKPQIVIDAIVDFYTKTNANVHRGIYDLSEKATEQYEEARHIIATFLGAEPHEVIFTSGTTDSQNKLASSIDSLFPEDIANGVILISEMEHHSNLVPWQQLAKSLNLRLEYIKVDDDYQLDIEDLTSKLISNKILVCAITHVSNSLGTINPINQISNLIKEKSPTTLFVVDGAQAVAHMPVNVSKLGVDFYSLSGHKMLGPTGIGVLYGRKELLEGLRPAATGGGMIRTVNKDHSDWAPVPERFEAGTPNIAGAVALGQACKYIESIGRKKIEDYENELTEYCLQSLGSIKGVTLYGPKALPRASVFSFSITGIHPHDIAHILNEENIAVRAGHHCNQILMKEVLCVTATTRVSLSIYNSKSDVDKLASGIEKVIEVFN